MKGTVSPLLPVNRVPAMVQLFVAHSFNFDSSKTVDAARV